MADVAWPLFLGLSFVLLVSFSAGRDSPTIFTLPRLAKIDNNSKVIFVNSSSGKDTGSCGQDMGPCQTIHFALDKAFRMDLRTVLIQVAPGSYPGDTLRCDCTFSKLKSIVIQGIVEPNKAVLVRTSVDIIKCNVSLVNLQWTNNNRTSPVLLNAVISILSMDHCIFSNRPFSIIGTGSRIYFTDNSINNCTGWQLNLPLISASSISGTSCSLLMSNNNFTMNRGPHISSQNLDFLTMDSTLFIGNIAGDFIVLVSAKSAMITNTNFSRNIGTLVKIAAADIVNISSSNFEDNEVGFGSVIEVNGGREVTAVRMSFVNTLGWANGPVVSVKSHASKFHIKNSFFGCTHVNGSCKASPVRGLMEDQLSCVNCTLDSHCPIYCNGGQYLKDTILCLSCPPGTYSTRNEVNTTIMTCRKCPAGYFSANSSSDSCHPCQSGTFSAQRGSTSCSPCKNDFLTSDKGQASCSKMTLGFLILTICVCLLIVVPLIIMFCQRRRNSSKPSPPRPKQSGYRQMREPGDVNVLVVN